MATRKNEEKPKATEIEKDEPRETPEESSIEVELEEPEEDEEEVAADGEEEAEPRPSRKEKKRQRGNAFREAQERAAAAEAKAAQLEAERQQYIQQMQLAQQQQQIQQQGNQELEKVYEDQKTLYAAFEAAQQRGQMSDAEAREWERKARELEARKYAAIARTNGMGQQVNAQQIAAYVEVEHLKTELSDILSNPAAKAWGEGRAYQIASERGMPQTKAAYLAIIREAAEETRQRFGLGQRQRRPAPDTATKSRFSGVPARSNGAGGETVRVSIGRDQRRMAAARYPELSEEEAVKKWANGPGKRASLAMQRKSG